MHLGIPMKIARLDWACAEPLSCRRCNLYCQPPTCHPSFSIQHLPPPISSYPRSSIPNRLPLFVSRPSPSLLAFVARNLVFIGFLGLNFNLVLARKPDLCTSRWPPYGHTYIHGQARCAANKAIYTRHSLCSTLSVLCALLRVGLSCQLHCHLWGLPHILSSLPVPIANWSDSSSPCTRSAHLSMH